MSKGTYTVYHYDIENRITGQPVGATNVDITTADHIAATQCNLIAGHQKKCWKRVTCGENCKFMIDGRRMGFMVIRNGIGPAYKGALKSQQRKVAL